MEINNAYSWTGTLGSEWSQTTQTQSNWRLLSGAAIQPNYPQGDGDEAFFGIDANLTSDNGSADAQYWSISHATVTLLSGHFEAGVEGAGNGLNGLNIIDGALIIDTVDGVVDPGGLDDIGLGGGVGGIGGGDGTLELQPGAGFDDRQMQVGDGANGRVTVNGATFEVVQSSPGASDGVLTIGLNEDNPQNGGNGSVDISGNSLFFAVTTTIGKDPDSTGELTLDDSSWGGTNLSIGPAGTGTVTIRNGSNAALTNVFIAGGAGSQGSFDISGSTVFLAGATFVGQAAGASGELTVNNSNLTVAGDVIIAPAGSDSATIENGSNAQLNSSLIIGETDGSDGSLDVSGSTLSVGGPITVGQDNGANGELSVDDSMWNGADLTIGGAGTGKVTVKDGSNATLNSIIVGARGELDVTAVGGSTATLSVPSLTLAFGTLTVSGGGEVNMNAPGVQGAVDVATTLVGLGTINGNIVVEQSGVVQADQPLDGTLTVNGNIHGTGTIEPLRTLEVNGGIDDGITIQFRAPSAGTSAGVLQLDVPRADDGTITDFSAGNTIKIEGLVYNQALFTPGTPGNAGVLTLSGDSDAPLELKIDGNYAPHAFLATLGATETVVTLSPLHDPSFPRSDLTGDGASDLLMDNQLVVGSLSAGALSYSGIGALGPEWDFNGTGTF